METILSPHRLTINLVDFAYHVTNQAKFSWQNVTEQSAYEILITKFNLNKLILDTGWINDKQNTAVEISNLNQYLNEGEVYYWQVRIKDTSGNISNYSQPERFIYGKQSVGEHGIWLYDPTCSAVEIPKLGNTVFFRSPHITLDADKVDSAVLNIIDRGNEPTLMQGCDIFFNGDSIGMASARPQANYRGTDKTAIFYNSFDITDQIKNDNVIALAATGSKRLSDDQADPNGEVKNTDEKNLEAVGASLIVQYSNGRKKEYYTDETWKAFDATNAYTDNGTKIRSQYFGMPAENVNTNFYPSGWMDNDFNDSDWFNAQVIERDLVDQAKEVLKPYTSENTGRFVEKLPQKVISLGRNDWLVDLGKEIIGSLVVDLHSDYDQRVVVRMGEQLLNNHHVRHHLAAGPDYVETWTLKKGENHFHTFQIKNFRYIELAGFVGEVKVDEIKPWASHQFFDRNESAFKCDNELLNEEYELSKYTIAATNQDVYVDSQARERRPYEGDLLVNANTSYSVSDHYSLARHSIDYLFDNPTWPKDYRFFLIETAWQDYMYTGDRSLLVERYQDLKNLFKFDDDQHDAFDPKVGLVTEMGLVDWPIKERDGYVEGKYNVPFNAAYAGACQVMEKVAQVVDQKADSQLFEKRYQTIKKNLITKLYDPKSGRYFDSMNEDLQINRHCSHHASAYALAYEMYDSKAMGDSLSKFVFNDGRFIGSIYFIYFMIKGLINTGHVDEVEELLANENDEPNAKTFAAIIDQLGATITPEAWSNYYKPNLTMSHPWGASPGLALIQGILGVVPLKPAFAEFRIQLPLLTKLNNVTATVPTIKGQVKIDLHQEGVTKVLSCKVPAGSKARVDFGKDISKVQIDGRTEKNEEGYFWINSGKHVLVY